MVLGFLKKTLDVKIPLSCGHSYLLCSVLKYFCHHFNFQQVHKLERQEYQTHFTGFFLIFKLIVTSRKPPTECTGQANFHMQLN